MHVCSGREQYMNYIEMREKLANGFWLPLEKYSRNEKNVAATNAPTRYRNLQKGSLMYRDRGPLKARYLWSMDRRSVL